MTRYLMIHLYGPLQSWGGVAVGEVRGNERCPSRSGVLGLVAAALGIDRSDDAAHEALHHHLGFGVRICNPGTLVRDYHTAQVPSQRKGANWQTRSDELAEPKINTVLSTRDYAADALFAVALWEQYPYDLQKIVDAFASPTFHLYLGRKSCPPGLPIKPKMVEAETLKAAFLRFRLPEPVVALFSETRTDINGLEIRFDHCKLVDEATRHVPRYDRIASRSRWTFVPRTEYSALLPENKES